MRKRDILLTTTMAALAALVLAPTVAVAKGKPGGGGGGGGGGEDPPTNAPAEIAFVRDNGTGAYDLMVCAADGSGVTTVLANAGNAYSHVDWSADGSWLVFQGVTSGAGIYKIKPDGTGLTKLAPLSSATFVDGPDWSPQAAADGSEWIIFLDYAGPDGEPDLHIVRPDGTGLRNLTDSSTVRDGSCSWSPDASELAVKTTDSSGNRSILVYEVTSISGVLTLGASPTDVTGTTLSSATNIATIDWSPDGSELIVDAIVSGYGGNYDLWSLDLITHAATNLTATSDVSESDPCFGADGTDVVYRYSGASGKTRKNDGLWALNGSLLKDSGAHNPTWKR